MSNVEGINKYVKRHLYCLQNFIPVTDDKVTFPAAVIKIIYIIPPKLTFT